MQRFKTPFVNLGNFMSSKIPNMTRPVARPVARPVVRRSAPVDTQAVLNAAQKAHYTAEDTKELKDKQVAFTKTQKKLATTTAAMQSTKSVKKQKKAAMDNVPGHLDKTQIIEEHIHAVKDYKDAKGDHDQAKKDHQAAKTAIKGGRRRRNTRPKRRKSKHRKRQTKKRRKRQTKKRRQSRRR
jgi:hypothetical protein